MAKRVGVDKWLFGVVLLLVLFGLAMVFSASAVVAESQYGSPYYFVVKELGFALAGLLVMTLLMRLDYRHYNSPKGGLSGHGHHNAFSGQRLRHARAQSHPSLV